MIYKIFFRLYFIFFLMLNFFYIFSIFALQDDVKKLESSRVLLYLPDLSIKYSCRSIENLAYQNRKIQEFLKKNGFYFFESNLTQRAFDTSGHYPHEISGFTTDRRIITFIQSASDGVDGYITFYSEPPTNNVTEFEREISSLVSNKLNCQILDQDMHDNPGYVKLIYDQEFSRLEKRYEMLETP